MKKKFMAMLLSMTMVLSMGITGFAQEVTATITDKEEQSADAGTEEEGMNNSDAEEEATGEITSSEETSGKVYVALGADLTEDQKAVVLSLMGISDLSEAEVCTVTNSDEHDYLDKYFDSSVIGTKSLSSVCIREAAEGSGINVTTYNISTCTETMYENALATAGLEDADIIVAAPTPISGTSALVGVSKALGAKGVKLDMDKLDAAINELAVTGSITSIDPELAAEIISEVKDTLIEGGYTDAESIGALVDELCEQYSVTLTDDEKSQIVDFAVKLVKAEQVKSGITAVFSNIGSFFSDLFSKLFG